MAATVPGQSLQAYTRLRSQSQNGVYRYSLRPQGAFYSANGNVTVSDSDVTVTLNGPVVSCTTTTSGG